MPLDGINNLIKSLSAFDTEAEVLSIVEANKEEITKLEREQLSYGIGKDGNSRSDEYRPLTVYLKKRFGFGLGAVTDRVTFFQTGQLYGSLFTVVNGSEFNTVSQLSTYDKMIERIGADNYGLSPDQSAFLRDETILPAFAQSFKKKTGIELK